PRRAEPEWEQVVACRSGTQRRRRRSRSEMLPRRAFLFIYGSHRPSGNATRGGGVRLAVKLSLLLACAVTVPLLLVLAVLLPRGSGALQAQLRQLFAQDARALALECQKTVLDD